MAGKCRECSLHFYVHMGIHAPSVRGNLFLVMSNAGERLKYTTAVILYGTIGMFLRNVSLPSEVTAMYRGILGSLFILLFRHLTKHPMGITGWIGTVLVIGSALLGELHGTGQ